MDEYSGSSAAAHLGPFIGQWQGPYDMLHLSTSLGGREVRVLNDCVMTSLGVQAKDQECRVQPLGTICS
jgi:hypothetical protein